jgi:hypothetical protein
MPKDTDFELRSRPADPALVDGQLRIAVRYLSIDPAMRVWMSDQKSYWPPVALGEVMRASAIGEIIESRHPRFPQGQWVNGMLGVQEQLISDGKGMKLFDASQLPDPTWALSVLGGTGLTAYFGLKEIGQIKAGETVVVSAAAGAVGSAVVQIAKLRGCKVIGIAGGPDKCAFVKEQLGADGVIDYKDRTQRLGPQLGALCPDGIDVYFDNVGGDILDAVLKRLKLKARIVVCGGISQYNSTGAQVGPSNYLALISARARMEGFVVIDYLHRSDEAYAELVPWMLAGKLKNQVDIIDGLPNFPQALRRVYNGTNFGKQVVRL